MNPIVEIAISRMTPDDIVSACITALVKRDTVERREILRRVTCVFCVNCGERHSGKEDTSPDCCPRCEYPMLPAAP